MFGLKIDIRIFKMAFSIFACISLYYIFGQEDRVEAMMVSCLSAILGIDPQTSNMVDFTKQRLIGTAVGGAIGSLYYVIVELADVVAVFQIVFIPVLCIAGAYLVGGSKRLNAVKGVIATLIMVTLIIEPDQGFRFALIRLIATAVGAVVAILVNVGFHVIRDIIQKKQRNS
ncbi:MAG: FUSC family protein [Christensenella sp.]|uniref:FUSC family protein n=1 Tax=Christensenella sp. TaxID=1935934 RepID=UPI002B1FD2B1|nr:FUSC family protein [Christensenella sp.]MEA5003738.1 FUSC family protein [Christensenella sp.]